MRIGIDLMGSDSSPQILFEAVLQVARQLDSSYSLVAIASAAVISDLQHAHQAFFSQKTAAQISFHLASETIDMQDDPLWAVSLKKDSSLVVGIRLLKKARINAFVSAGNTGALIACATLNLRRLPSVKRPALLVVLPTLNGSVAVLDVGANIASTAQHLVQFARMGAVYQRCNSGIEVPRVGLLNIGVEPQKGTSSVRKAYQILQECAFPNMQFIGNIEGDEVFKGRADVLVADGFTGNVFLKTAEGVSSFVFESIARVLKDFDKTAPLEILQNLRAQLHYSEYPGAIVCGVEGVVIKCHGHSSSQAMSNGILGAIALIQKSLIAKMKEECQRA